MHDTLPAGKRTGGVLRLFIIGMLTIATTLEVNLIVRALAFAVWPLSPVFLPLQIGAISAFTVILVGGGVLVYAVVTRFSKRPAHTYITIALLALLLSLIPPILLAFHPDPGALPGVTPLAASLLIILHSIDALIVLTLLLLLAPSKGRAAKEDIQ